MRWLRAMAVGAALALASGSAIAFQEQQTGSAPSKPPAAEAPSPDAGKGTAVAPIEPPPLPSGTEIRIPGLGKLGVIPKMDFGLELLYGATDTKPKHDERTEKEDQQLMIRGSIKHKF